MTTNADARLAREWAEDVQRNYFPEQHKAVVAAARHILATTAPPTMADLDWDNDVHAGLCAMYADGDLVLMIGPDLDNEGFIICHWVYRNSPATGRLPPENLTPIPGTKIDLTPRCEPVPTPDHPTELTTEADYRSAPAGTVVATEGEGAWTWTKGSDGAWETYGIIDAFSNYGLSGEARRVLRWGWSA